MVSSDVEKTTSGVLADKAVPVLASAEERDRAEKTAKKYALAQERWTQHIRQRRMEEYGDPDNPLPVWPVKPPDVPLEELERIHALIVKEFDDPDAFETDVA